MNTKTYNYIKQCLEMGYEVKVKSEYGIYEKFRNQEYLDRQDSSFIMQHYTDEYEIIPRIPKLLQPGDKCVIIDTEETRKYAEEMDWYPKKKALIGTVQQIQELYDGYVVNIGYNFPYFMVAPVPPEENKLADVDTEEIVKELESRGILVDGKVLK